MEIRAIPPGVWTKVGGVEVYHQEATARSVEIYAGVVHFREDAEWKVRSAEPRTVEHRTMSGETKLFAQPSAAGRSSVRDAQTPGPVFEARYRGVCPECGDEIEEGDRCRMVDGSATHVECLDDEPAGSEIY